MPTPFEINTKFTTLLGIRHPIVLAGMAGASKGRLVAAVSNAGGLGVIGGFQCTPDELRYIIEEMKQNLTDPNLPFGVNLLLPQLGGNARRTNHDCTDGKLSELIDIIIDSGARLFVSAVGVPSKEIVNKLHQHNILVMNMVGHPKHAVKALERDVDIVCAQGMEAGGHTGDISTMVLVPAVVDIAKTFAPSMLRGSTALVVAAGGIYDGRGIAGALMLGASAVWVGTRFVATTESSSTEEHKKAILACGFADTDRTLVVTGRPLRVKMNKYIKRWHEEPEKIRALCNDGMVPIQRDVQNVVQDIEMPYFMGQVAGAVEKIQSAEVVIREMVDGAMDMLKLGATLLGSAGFA